MNVKDSDNIKKILEYVAGAYNHRNLSDQVEDHEGRLSKLELAKKSV